MSPDGSKVVPPEEKLLRLIRGKARGSVEGPIATAAPSSPGPRGAIGRFRAVWRIPTWYLRAVNVGLGCLVLGEILALLFVVSRPMPTLLETEPQSDRPLTQSGLPVAIQRPEEPAGQTEALASLSSLASRQMFLAAEGPGASPGQGTSVPSAEAKALAGRLSLIGIVAGNPPQAIIEDAQTRKTYFATTGQGVIEGLIVQEVQEHRVILDLNGEKLELSL